ncbi:MAG: DUF1311 domain-containing protein [Bacteroidetes bacterium]|nr:DUF1311 domain-containing protein [Bacteroidota bacterium]
MNNKIFTLFIISSISFLLFACGQEKQIENKTPQDSDSNKIKTYDSISISTKQDTIKRNPWDIGCDTMDTQMDMNACSYESLLIADSILTLTYNKLLYHLDSSFSAEKKNLTNNKDNFSLEYLRTLKNQKASLIEAQKHFIEYRNSLSNTIGLNYHGGTMRYLVENTYALDLTINQINIITKMSEEIIE